MAQHVPLDYALRTRMPSRMPSGHQPITRRGPHYERRTFAIDAHKRPTVAINAHVLSSACLLPSHHHQPCVQMKTSTVEDRTPSLCHSLALPLK